MNSYLVILKDKRNGELSNDLLTNHVTYLKRLRQQGSLMLCGPFVDDDGAVMVFQSESVESVEELLNNDPFVYEKYYQSYEIKEFLEANDGNNWLVGVPQTKGNLID
ncbi:YciI family protein [Oceanobacillus sp. CFH 90083]|uniref:YciI family protein n=1 Tax=Oceanobacillus sp. CFH 90083 TaxID=2592336 RepID=UPI0018833E29|nr:YciI family protein [Oceanobacillus sp. CFH 90083]